MTRNLKALGLALAAVFAMSAVAASSASALSSFTSPAGYPQTLVTEDAGAADAFHVGDDSLTCKNEVFDGKLEEATESIKVTPTYVDCKTEGATSDNVTVTHNGCEFEFASATTIETDVDGVSVAIVGCDDRDVGIEIHHYDEDDLEHNQGSTCTNTVTPQDATGHLIATSETDGDQGDILLEGEVEVEVRTHGECSFFFTLDVSSTYTASTTVSAASGDRIHLG
jgi:hypothetical protein